MTATEIEVWTWPLLFSDGRNFEFHRLPKMRFVQRTRPMPEAINNALTTSSNCRSERRLKMHRPNQAPSKAAGTKAHTFQSSCPCTDDDGRIRWIAISVTGCMLRMK